MAAPTFIASYSSNYANTTSTATVSVTTLPGDVLVVYGGAENQNGSLTTPTGNSVAFSLVQSVAQNLYSDANVWAAIDATGGTNWTLSVTNSGPSLEWGFSCLVFRNSTGIGASNSAFASASAPSVSLSTLKDNSALVVFNSDYDNRDGTTRTWRTVNGITPTNGNALERNYYYGIGTWTAYGAYYNDAGSAGSKTVGLSVPNNQKYSIVALEVYGPADMTPMGWII